MLNGRSSEPNTFVEFTCQTLIRPVMTKVTEYCVFLNMVQHNSEWVFCDLNGGGWGGMGGGGGGGGRVVGEMCDSALLRNKKNNTSLTMKHGRPSYATKLFK